MSEIANSTVPEGSTEEWTDKKRYLWLIGLVVPSLAASLHRCLRPAPGSRSCLWLGPIMILVVIPRST